MDLWKNFLKIVLWHSCWILCRVPVLFVLIFCTVCCTLFQYLRGWLEVVRKLLPVVWDDHCHSSEGDTVPFVTAAQNTVFKKNWTDGGLAYTFIYLFSRHPLFSWIFVNKCHPVYKYIEPSLLCKDNATKHMRQVMGDLLCPVNSCPWTKKKLDPQHKQI